MERTLLVTLTLKVRDMTDEEFADATQFDVGPDIDEEGEEIEDDFKVTNDFVKDVSPDELRETLEYALRSEGNDEMFAGSSLYLVTEQANITSIGWLDETPSVAAVAHDNEGNSD